MDNLERAKSLVLEFGSSGRNSKTYTVEARTNRLIEAIALTLLEIAEELAEVNRR